jgi:hypothetical protein
MWLGVKRVGNISNFVWNSNEELLTSSFAKWFDGEPNNANSNEDCVEMIRDFGFFNDAACSKHDMTVICEVIFYAEADNNVRNIKQ